MIDQHCLQSITQHRSPNCDERPKNMSVSLIVLHGISLPPGEFGGQYVHDLFMNQLKTDQHPYFEKIASLKVSSHLFIQRTGAVIQYVPFYLRAWHAGASSFNNQLRCNDFSIGIELEGDDDSAYDVRQYNSLMPILTALGKYYPATKENPIVGHQHIAPGRKTDPGASFDWLFLHKNGFRVID